MSPEPVPILEHRNEVHLVGRVSADPVLLTLPSGDSVVSVRLVVERARPPAGDVVEVDGSLRRRFWRAEGVPQSRYEVELSGARRLARARAPQTR